MHLAPTAATHCPCGDDSDEDTGLGTIIIAISPTHPEAFFLEIDVPLSGASEQKPKRIKVKATRLQVPLAIQNASALCTL